MRVYSSKKRLVIEVDDATHYAIKSLALERNITMRKWVVRALIEALKKENLYKSLPKEKS